MRVRVHPRASIPPRGNTMPTHTVKLNSSSVTTIRVIATIATQFRKRNSLHGIALAHLPRVLLPAAILKVLPQAQLPVQTPNGGVDRLQALPQVSTPAVSISDTHSIPAHATNTDGSEADTTTTGDHDPNPSNVGTTGDNPAFQYHLRYSAPSNEVSMSIYLLYYLNI